MSARDPAGSLHRILQNACTGSCRNYAQDPAGCLHRIRKSAQEVCTGSCSMFALDPAGSLHRMPAHEPARDPAGCLYRILQDAWTESCRMPAQDPAGCLHKILQDACTRSCRMPAHEPAGFLRTLHRKLQSVAECCLNGASLHKSAGSMSKLDSLNTKQRNVRLSVYQSNRYLPVQTYISTKQEIHTVNNTPL